MCQLQLEVDPRINPQREQGYRDIERGVSLSLSLSRSLSLATG